MGGRKHVENLSDVNSAVSARPVGGVARRGDGPDGASRAQRDLKEDVDVEADSYEGAMSRQKRYDECSLSSSSFCMLYLNVLLGLWNLEAQTPCCRLRSTISRIGAGSGVVVTRATDPRPAPGVLLHPRTDVLYYIPRAQF
ncbi:hypothetical protein LSAT2_031133 [Lamellibrachia satsuma]|nr:hypothetical protein LSAT2_031133 [Lamellibrachia satsuma]